MAAVSSESKQHYFEKIKNVKAWIKEADEKSKKLKEVIEKSDEGGSYKKLSLIEGNLRVVSYYLLMNLLSVSFLGAKNEGFLNDARKLCYQIIIYLEQIVSSYIDVPFSDYEEYLAEISEYTDIKRYNLIRKIGYAIQSVEDGFGQNTKWKWSFVELEGRYAAVAKNILDLKRVVAGLDPQKEGYEARMQHINLVKKLLQQSADRYRQKYELSTMRYDDFRLAINYLAALRRIHIALNESSESEQIKRKMNVWKEKMESDEKQQKKNSIKK